MGRLSLLSTASSRTDRRGERNRERRKRKKTEEANERWREERNRSSEDLQEAWRRNHPSEHLSVVLHFRTFPDFVTERRDGLGAQRAWR